MGILEVVCVLSIRSFWSMPMLAVTTMRTSYRAYHLKKTSLGISRVHMLMHICLTMYAPSFSGLALALLTRLLVPFDLGVSGDNVVHLFRSLASTGALDDLLDQLLDSIPITCINRYKVGLEVVRDVVQLRPAVLVVHEGEGDTNTSKSSGSANTV